MSQLPRRILLLITDLQIGGTPTVVRELAIRLTRTGSFQCEVACLAPHGPVVDQLLQANIPTVALGAQTPADLPRTIARLHALIADRRFDCVFSFLLHANVAAAMVSPFFWTTRFLQSIQTTQPDPRWHWWLHSVVHHAAQRVVVPSPSAARCAVQWSDIPPEKIAVIPNAVDLPDIAPRGDGTRFRIGFIGRLDPIKRVGDLVEALAKLPPPFVLEIFGGGSERTEIEQQIVRLKLQDRVRLAGAIPHPAPALAAIDLLVLPSAAEGFGLVLIEAMAAGVPVVATDVPGIRDVVANGKTGLLVPVGSPAAIADAVQRITADQSLAERLIAAGKAYVQSRYTWERVLPQYISLLE